MYEHFYQHKIDDRIRQGKSVDRIQLLTEVEEAFYRYKNDTLRELAFNHVYYAAKPYLKARSRKKAGNYKSLRLCQDDFESVFNEIIWTITEKYEPTDDSLLLEYFDRTFDDRSKNVVRDVHADVRFANHSSLTYDDTFMDLSVDAKLEGDYRGVPIDGIKKYYADKRIDDDQDEVHKELVMRIFSVLQPDERELIAFKADNPDLKPTEIAREFGLHHETYKRKLASIRRKLDMQGLNPLGRVIVEPKKPNTTKNNTRKAV